MRVLAFRHVPFEHLGRIADALADRGVPVRYADLFADAGAPADADIDAAAGLIFMGGPMSANDDLPWLRREMELIRQAVARRRPVLGVCLGAQLLAKALGSRIYRNPVKEIGWFPVRFTQAARDDRLVAGLDTETIFHWHGDTFDLPGGAALLASSDACLQQAFRWGESAYGLQFHLEVTPEMIGDWCAQDANCGDMREVAAPIEPRAHAARLRELSDLVFGRWCELLR